MRSNGITDKGIYHADLYEFLTETITLVNELKADFNLLHADVTGIRTKIVNINAKLDADAGVTDTNYGALQNPAAMTATTIAASDLSLT